MPNMNIIEEVTEDRSAQAIHKQVLVGEEFQPRTFYRVPLYRSESHGPLQEILMVRILVILLLAAGAVQAKPTQPSVLVWDIDQDHVVMGQNLNTIRSIASITKIMTAMVTLQHDGDLDRRITVKAASHLGAGRHSRRDVITAMLVRSDNEAAEALARDYPGGRDAFIRVMNHQARAIGLDHARFHDTSGLHAGNRATAGEVADLMVQSLKYPIIGDISVQRQALFEQNRGGRIRQIVLPNTNRPLLYQFDSIIASKTGFTRVAGWCVGLVVQRGDRRVVIVVLGADSKQQRFDITQELVYNQLRDAEVDQRHINIKQETPKQATSTSWWDRMRTWIRP